MVVQLVQSQTVFVGQEVTYFGHIKKRYIHKYILQNFFRCPNKMSEKRVGALGDASSHLLGMIAELVHGQLLVL